MTKKCIPQVLLALTLILCSSCSTNDDPDINDPYLKIPDARFEMMLIEQGIDSDGIVNQQVLKKDVELVNRLTLEFVGGEDVISDLTGIEGFINLTHLSATQHEIESIDLNSNTLLDTVYLSGNYISSIDLSNNQNLILADIQSNQLSSVTGLSGLRKLKKLNLSWNELKELSIHNESLEVLHVSQNLLTSLDTDGAINLKNILLTSNQLTSIDLSTNTLLETLLISDNQLQSIDLRSNGTLTHLYISSNTLMDLDVSNNLKLVELKADRNPDLRCIKIQSDQNIPSVSKSDYQELNSICN